MHCDIAKAGDFVLSLLPGSGHVGASFISHRLQFYIPRYAADVPPTIHLEEYRPLCLAEKLNR